MEQSIEVAIARFGIAFVFCPAKDKVVMTSIVATSSKVFVVRSFLTCNWWLASWYVVNDKKCK